MQGERRRFLPFFSLCMATYLLAYVCRVNMAGALGKLGDAFPDGTAWLGAIGSGYFIVYAVGQLVNGFLGDRLPPGALVSVAIVGTSAVNAAVPLCAAAWQIALVWAVNGVFQSMFWGPMMRALALSTPPGRQGGVATGMSASFLAGYLVSWVALGFLLRNLPWRWNFWVPALMMLPMLPLWRLAARSAGGAGAERAIRLPVRRSLRAMREQGLLKYVPICVCLGVVKESVSYWAPVLFLRLMPERGDTALFSLALLPAANFLGLFLSGRFLRRMRVGRALLLMLGAMAAASFGALAWMGAPWAAVGMIAGISAMGMGLNNVLLGYVPLLYAGEGIVSSLIGLLDFASYVGAAVSTWALGLLLRGGGPGGAPLVWCAASFLALGLALAFGAAERRNGRVREA